MNDHTYYTALGHFRRKTNGLGQSRPKYEPVVPYNCI